MSDNLKTLINRLSPTLKKGMEAAAALCVNRGHYEVAVEHLLSVLLDDPQGDARLILKHYGVDHGRLQRALQGTLDQARGGNPGRPVFSPILIEWLNEGWIIASLELGHADLRSGVLFAALLRKDARLCAGDYSQLWAAIPADEVVRKLDTLVVGSQEPSAGNGASEGKPAAGGGKPGEGAIAKFCTDFTAKAKEGKVDPVFGRDDEIRQIIDILARRRKNNPICVGEPGVGKTAVVEGLALRVTQGDVPDVLKGVKIIGLDLGLLQAGASVKGEFENRLKGVLEEVKSSPTPVILFIDEAHTLIGAGGAAGTADAANLLKPALARGEMKTIAATTWAEYKKYFEKDAALARRFQLVKLEEPSVETTHTMLRGLRDTYEKAHGVVIRDDALYAAAWMGARYITGRQHPDKGIDLVDTAAARVKVALATKPNELEQVERRIQDRERAQKSLKRDQETGGAFDAEAAAAIEAQLATDRERAVQLTTTWQAEKVLADKAIAARSELIAAPGDAAKRAAFDAAMAALKEKQGDKPLMHVEVTPEVVAKVIGDWTGVPVGSMVKNEAQTLLSFEAELKKRIKGQDHVHEIVGKGIRAAKAGLKDPRTPIGIFLFVGPSGVGKTETATAVADLMFGGERFMTTVNMSEYQEKHTISRLVGSPPGYVGYGEGGVLTEAVRQRPYSVVLLDEVEKASLDVMNLFYQVFDKGTLSDGEGREIDFKDTVMFLTSNLATDMIMQACDDPELPKADDLVAAIRPILSKHFKPALLARMTIVPFFPLKQDALQGIARLKLSKVSARMKATHKMDLVFTDAVVAAIAARCTEAETGARNVDHVITGNLLPRISTEVLSRLGAGDLPPKLTVGYDEQSGFTYEFGG
ncbi:MAG: type VI secretion system ATPase TssH [Planctomycetes bacterium]|nr:type VI secretion system ATPase TssH [Planctomycetota bacterium]